VHRDDQTQKSLRAWLKKTTVSGCWSTGSGRAAYRKKVARIDLWLKEIAPNAERRKWFGHDPSKWSEFRKRYFRELNNNPDAVTELKTFVRKGAVTLVFAARYEEYNNAVVLKDYLESSRGDLRR